MRCLSSVFCLEKVAFQSEQEFATSRNSIASAGVQAWVNCPRRYWGGYNFLRPLILENLIDCGEIYCSVNGSNFGLACNAVHFIDLFAYLFGDSKLDYDAEVQLVGAIKEIRQGKFVEFCGAIKGNIFRQASGLDKAASARYTIQSTEGDGEPLLICLQSDKFHIFINERSQEIFSSFASEGWSLRITNLDIALQSALTNAIVEQLINDGRCNLTPLSDSESYHLPLLDAITRFLSSTTTQTFDRCPIT